MIFIPFLCLISNTVVLKITIWMTTLYTVLFLFVFTLTIAHEVHILNNFTFIVINCLSITFACVCDLSFIYQYLRVLYIFCMLFIFSATQFVYLCYNFSMVIYYLFDFTISCIIDNVLT